MSAKQGQRNAFTLAEVLITLGIIGVVAAITMPTLIKKYQNIVLARQLNVMYSLISQALITTKQELGCNSIYSEYTQYNPTSGYYRKGEFTNAFYRQLKVVRILSKEEIPKYSTYSSPNIEYRATNPSFWVLYPNRLLPNGATVLANIGGSIDGLFVAFTVDVNGTQKPNRFGHDLFKFVIKTPDDRLVGDKKTRDYSEEELEDINSPYNDLLGVPCSKNSKQSVNGQGCAWYALQDICPDDSSRKYWECLP